MTEKNFLVFLTVFFIFMTIWVITVPYDPMNGDIADATTNAIWAEYYKEGKYAVTYDQWKADGRPATQSVVVNLDGTPYVVNEKGPAHAMFIVILGSATGVVFAAIGTISTYMLGRRMFGWQVGAISSLLVLTNSTVIVMWYKCYWVDSSTVHLSILSMWLFVESGLKMKAFIERKSHKDMILSVMIGIGGGVAFGAAISTRYTVAIIIVPAMIYAVSMFWKVFAHAFKNKNMRSVGKTIGHMTLFFLPFFLGLMMVLVPLMNYNNTYFGGPFRSGYDATTLMDYQRSNGKFDTRNQTDYITSDPVAKINVVLKNTVAMTPLMLLKMPFIVFVPFSIWALRKRPILYLLLPWALFIMIGFYSLSWIEMYARMPWNPWEPRYHMPALPPLSILAAYGLYTIALPGTHGAKETKKGWTRPVLALTVVGMIVFSSMAPVDGYFKDVRDGKNPGMPKNNQPPGNQDKPPLVTVSRLYDNANEYSTKNVVVQNCTIVFLEHAGGTGDIIRIDVRDASSPRNLSIRPLDWPSGTLPPMDIGRKMTVIGYFIWEDIDKDGQVDDKELFVNVKYETADKIIVQP